jgi:hypothetical protein
MAAHEQERRYEALLGKAKRGEKLPESVLSSIRHQLEIGQFETNPYTLIHILGKARDHQSTPLICRYLHYGVNDRQAQEPDLNNEDMVRRISLQVLGLMWKRAEVFDAAADKAFHDPSPYVRAMAATVIGTLGAAFPILKRHAARLLVQGLERRHIERDIVWEAFHDGVLNLLGVPANQWPPATRPLKEEDIRWDIIEKAKEVRDC